MSRAGEKRAANHHTLIAATAATAVGAAAVGATFVSGGLADVAAVAAPAMAAALISPLVARRFIGRPLEREAQSAAERSSVTKRALHEERQERIVLRELDRALDQAPAEPEAIKIIDSAFSRHLGQRCMELHLVDAVDPVLTLAVATGHHEVQPAGRVSPWEALAARTNRTLVYDTTDRLDVCGHLKSRVARPMSAVAVPLNATGRLLGVLYGLAPEGEEASKGSIDFLEDLAGVMAARIAVIRSVDASSRADAVDRLTGLPDRGAMQERVLRLLKERQPFSIAVADIDNFGKLNDSQGRDAGDSALRTLAQVARRTIRPEDVVGRIGGDELLFVLPRTKPHDATRALERLREELVLAQSTGDEVSFTLSIGVIGSTTGTSIEEMLHRAAGALDHAKKQGGNRVVVAQPTKTQPKPSD